MFSCSRIVLAELKTNKRFFTDLENSNRVEEYSEIFYDPGEF